MRSKSDRFNKEKEKGEKIFRKRKREKYPSNDEWIELKPQIQRTIIDMENPYITCIERFFILESSIDSNPGSILRLYKDRDKAEKFIRSLKEGLFFITFLTDFIINLTYFSQIR
ncbi:MAG: hypothetical protein QXO19_03825 [Candidatus Aenigmatarchaeota archaeon]